MYTNGKNQSPTGWNASPGKIWASVAAPLSTLFGSSPSDHLLVCHANQTLEFKNSMQKNSTSLRGNVYSV